MAVITPISKIETTLILNFDFPVLSNFCRWLIVASFDLLISIKLSNQSLETTLFSNSLRPRGLNPWHILDKVSNTIRTRANIFVDTGDTVFLTFRRCRHLVHKLLDFIFLNFFSTDTYAEHLIFSFVRYLDVWRIHSLLNKYTLTNGNHNNRAVREWYQ